MRDEENKLADPSSDMFHQALFVEVGVGTLALLLGYLAGFAVWNQIIFRSSGLQYGLVAAIPMLSLLLLTEHVTWGPLKELDTLVQHLVRELFADCHAGHFAVLSLAAGFGEELFFRGLVQSFAEWACGSQWLGILIAACLFGLAHPITRTYFGLATLIGAYFGWIWVLSENLLVPIVAHAVYDFIALLWVSRRIKRADLEQEDGTDTEV